MTDDQLYGSGGFSGYENDATLQPASFDPGFRFGGSSHGSLDGNLDADLAISQWLNDDIDMFAVDSMEFDETGAPFWPISFDHDISMDVDVMRPTEPGSGVSISTSPLARPASVDELRQGLVSRPAKRLRRDQIAVLDGWLLEHINDPYPTEAEKLDLAANSNLTKKQIENWFARTRQRKIPPPGSRPDASPRQATLSDDIQVSLEVGPASPSPSLSDTAVYASDITASSLRCAYIHTKQSLCGHDGSMLQWWLDNLPAVEGGFHKKDHLEEHIECDSCFVVNVRLKQLEESLSGRHTPSWWARRPVERALARLADLVSADFWLRKSKPAFLHAFRSYDHANHPLVAETLNDIDCSLTLPSPVEELIVNIELHLGEHDLTWETSCMHEWLERLAAVLEGSVQKSHSRPSDGMSTSTNSEVESSRKKGSQRYICTGYPPCSLSFTRSEHLARHTRKHTGERPFQCHCERRFSRLENLRQHAEIVHINEAMPIDVMSFTRFSRQVPKPQQGPRTARSPWVSEPFERRRDHDSRSIGSRRSAGSAGSACSYTSYGPRQGRKRPRAQSLGSGMPITDGADTKGFACSSCPEKFSTNYARKRHIQSIHEPRETWVCDPGLLAHETFECCVWCPRGKENFDFSLFPQCSHSNAMDWNCMGRPRDERTFYRKDLLLQHLRGPHKAAEDCFAIRNVELLRQELPPPVDMVNDNPFFMPL